MHVSISLYIYTVIFINNDRTTLRVGALGHAGGIGPQNAYPQSPLEISILESSQNVYPQSHSKIVPQFPLKSLPKSPQNIPQSIYPQAPSKCMSPIPLKISIPNNRP